MKTREERQRAQDIFGDHAPQQSIMDDEPDDILIDTVRS